MEIVELDVHDDAALKAWYDVERAAVDHDRPQAVTRTYDALANSWRNPSDYRRPVPIVAVVDGVIRGIADLAIELQDNTHLADLEISVHPDFRRRGIGRALHDVAERRRRELGRTSACGEVYLPAGVETSAGVGFAEAMGYESVHVEDHLTLPLPVAEETLASLRGRAVSGYEILTWRNRCPDELVPAYCEMRTRMASDVPMGDLDYEPVAYTEERLRVGEERNARSYDSVVAAARRTSDGPFGGYSLVFLAHGSDQALQDDTLVMPDHRGHRLGTTLKLATLDVLLRDYPERRSLHTWTDPDNHAMYRTNTDFGYRPVEVMHEMQRKDGPADG